MISRYYVAPPLIKPKGYDYLEGKTYSEYNYLKPGLVSWIKTRRFEMALRITREYFQKANVIDAGCGDGPFIPSLSKHFNQVVAIDPNRDFIEICRALVKQLKLKNVQLICNRDGKIVPLKKSLKKKDYQIIFLLGVLEHFGDKKNLYPSKIDFLKNLFTLLESNGRVLILVPRMVGMPFVIQRIGLMILGLHREKISFRDFFKAAFFCNTDQLEKRWNHDHLGFNDKKLERFIRKDFYLEKKKNLLFQTIYLIRKKNNE